jgi:putative spermidine/putrescine transport system permease protein
MSALSELVDRVAKPSGLRGRRRKFDLRGVPWVLLPLLTLLIVFFAWPVLRLLLLSLVDPRSGALSLAQYIKLFSSPVYVQVLAITFKIAALTTLITLVGGYPIAYLLATAGRRTRGLVILAVLLPFWTSVLVRTLAWIVLLGKNGIINSALKTFGVIDAPLPLVFNLTGVVIGMSHALMPLAVLTMFAVMQGIPRDLARAAETLGASPGQVFWRIYFPLSLPGVAASGLMVFITSLGFFITPALLGGRRETMITQVIIEQVQTLLNWGFAGAVSMLLMGATITVLLLYDQVLGLSMLVGEGKPRRNGHVGPLTKAGVALLGGLGNGCDCVSRLGERFRRHRTTRGRGASRVPALLLLAFLALPTLFVVPISFTQSGFIEWPLVGFSLRWYNQILTSPLWISATLRSLGVGVVVALCATAIATPAAFILVRGQIRGRAVLLAFLLSPMILPHLIIAVALFYLYARIGLVGTSAGLVIGHTVIAVPYVVITVMAVLKSYDRRLDQAAATLGARPVSTLRRVTLPLIRPGLVSAAIFAFIISFDELTIALFTTGGLTETLPKQMWDDAVMKVSPALAAVSTLMLVFVSLMVLLAEWLRRRSASAPSASQNG